MNAIIAPYQVRFSSGVDQPLLELDGRRHFPFYPDHLRENDRAHLRPYNVDVSMVLSARMIDLVRIARAIHVVDQFIARRGDSDGYRNPVIEVEVLDIDFWNDCRVATALKDCIDFVSGGEDWHVRFIADERTRHYRQHTVGFSEPTTICLYSGGLDSAAGLAARLREDSSRTIVPVFIRKQFNRTRIVADQIRILKQRYGIEDSRLFPFLVASFTRRRRIRNDLAIAPREPTHRCRSFLFTTIGGLVAAVEGADRVEIYESGIGAVNLPLVEDMTGWRTTRSAHPNFLRLMSELVSLVVGRPIRFELPFLHRTKAEMVSVLVEDGLINLALGTVSCIMHPLRCGARQCGTCPACVYRRYALQSAGIEEPAGTYQYDLFGSAREFDSVPQADRDALRVFLHQADKLLDAESDLRFLHNHVTDTNVAQDEAGIARFIAFFRRYGREWGELIEHGLAQGRPWARWLRCGKEAA
jgi:7-cyano-7-deazaguanine synthase in queuosine biosynthesis